MITNIVFLFDNPFKNISRENKNLNGLKNSQSKKKDSDNHLSRKNLAKNILEDYILYHMKIYLRSCIPDFGSIASTSV